MIALSNFAHRKTATIPAWAKAVRLVGNGIDGYPPQLPEQLAVDEFLRCAKDFQLQSGGGEWDVLVYAVENPESECRTIWPYGRDNPYRRLRSERGRRVKLIAQCDYMRWTFFDFVKETSANEVQPSQPHN